MRRTWSWIAPATIFASLFVARVGEAGFLVTNLGVLQGGIRSDGFAINLSGATAGTALNSDFRERAVIGGGGTLSEVGVLPGGGFSRGFAINSSGIVAGESQIQLPDGTFATHAFRTTEQGGIIDLGTLPGDVASGARAIGGGGVAVGFSRSATGVTRAVRMNAPNMFETLGSLGGQNSQAFGINASGVIVGSAQNSVGVMRAFRTGPAGGMIEVGGFSSSGSSFASAINNEEVIVGYSQGQGGAFRAFISAGPGDFRDLGGLSFGTASFAFGINDFSDVVGQVDFSAGGPRAVLWCSGMSGAIDLNTLIDPDSGWTLLTASGINAKRQIVGTGLLNNQVRGFVLTPIEGTEICEPVPEPASWILLGIGAGLIGLERRRRLKRERIDCPAVA